MSAHFAPSQTHPSFLARLSRLGPSTTGILFLSGFLGVSACGTAPPADAPDAATDGGAGKDAVGPLGVERAFAMLTGRFDSSAQAESSAAYFPVQLHTCPVDIPELGQRVLYVEQAMMDSLDAPYRQRLYIVEPGDAEGEVISTVTELMEPERFVGLCAGADVPRINQYDAIARPGCEVYLRAEGEGFTGGTEGNGCESTLQGANYATSEVTLTDTMLRSWDRGFDDAGNQRWGATQGPYVFDRKE